MIEIAKLKEAREQKVKERDGHLANLNHCNGVIQGLDFAISEAEKDPFISLPANFIPVTAADAPKPKRAYNKKPKPPVAPPTPESKPEPAAE